MANSKKIVTDIGRGIKLEENLPVYLHRLNAQYNKYATVKGCMNYYVLKEVVLEQEEQKNDINKYFSVITDLLQKHILDREPVNEKTFEAITSVRSSVEYKMKNLTAFTDGYEIYEYVLNRIEGDVTGVVDFVDTNQLSAKMFRYVFSDNDTVVINSKLQLLVAQLPVRMTKNKFFDIVTNTLSIYKGGERYAVDEFCDMLRAAVLIKKPDGFETEYPYLFKVYEALCNADYKEITAKEYDELTQMLTNAAEIINAEASVYMLMQEVINDTYTLLLTCEASEENDKYEGYKAALTILGECIKADDMEVLPMQLGDRFMALEGVQEEVYEDIVVLEAGFEDAKNVDAEILTKHNLSNKICDLDKVSKLLSTSLFADLEDKTENDSDTADSAYIMKLRDAMTEDLKTLFEGKDRRVVRSIMSKLLSSMPTFMNSQQEIQNYFDYTLENCKDSSELSACSRLVNEIMDEA